jgi:hypothetical protein
MRGFLQKYFWWRLVFLCLVFVLLVCCMGVLLGSPPHQAAQNQVHARGNDSTNEGKQKNERRNATSSLLIEQSLLVKQRKNNDASDSSKKNQQQKKERKKGPMNAYDCGGCEVSQHNKTHFPVGFLSKAFKSHHRPNSVQNGEKERIKGLKKCESE